LQILRTEKKPEHTRQYLATQQTKKKGTIIDALWSEHDHVQAMTGVKGFGGKW
jgi:hypothetical protein